MPVEERMALQLREEMRARCPRLHDAIDINVIDMLPLPEQMVHVRTHKKLDKNIDIIITTTTTADQHRFHLLLQHPHSNYQQVVLLTIIITIITITIKHQLVKDPNHRFGLPNSLNTPHKCITRLFVLVDLECQELRLVEV
jgi:hypothetical protein